MSPREFLSFHFHRIRYGLGIICGFYVAPATFFPDNIRRMVRVRQKERQKSRFSALTNDTCFFCGCEVGPANLTRDHFIPKSLGGLNNCWNRIPACKTCNNEKSARLPTPEESKKFQKLFPFPTINLLIRKKLNGANYEAVEKLFRPA